MALVLSVCYAPWLASRFDINFSAAPFVTGAPFVLLSSFLGCFPENQSIGAIGSSAIINFPSDKGF